LTKTTLENGNTLAFFVNNKGGFDNRRRSSFNNFPKGGANASPQEPKIEKDKSMIKCYSCHKTKYEEGILESRSTNMHQDKRYPILTSKQSRPRD
jgi:hypothetical protein